jgi:N-(2-amino-2-carboxyethyl)-L-glutamate synthase
MRDLKGGIVSCVGNTPLVELTNIRVGDFRLFAKLEGMNPGGSIKDRPALQIVQDGINTGQIKESTTIVEGTSGNMGIGLAQICRYLGLRFVCVVDTKVTPQNLRLLKLYGAEVEMVTEPDPVTGDLLQARINKAKEIAGSIPCAFWVNQYANPSNSRAHHKTIAEVVKALDGRVDYIFCAASSCGTMRGCGDYLTGKGLADVRMVVADSTGSVIFGGKTGPRLIPGHGAGIRPDLFFEHAMVKNVKVTDREAVFGCRLLLAREALLVGGSSGAVFMAVDHVKNEIPMGANCVILLPDRGERYLDTIFNDEWVEEKFKMKDLDLMLQFEPIASEPTAVDV